MKSIFVRNRQPFRLQEAGLNLKLILKMIVFVGYYDSKSLFKSSGYFDYIVYQSLNDKINKRNIKSRSKRSFFIYYRKKG